MWCSLPHPCVRRRCGAAPHAIGDQPTCLCLSRRCHGAAPYAVWGRSGSTTYRFSDRKQIIAEGTNTQEKKGASGCSGECYVSLQWHNFFLSLKAGEPRGGVFFFLFSFFLLFFSFLFSFLFINAFLFLFFCFIFSCFLFIYISFLTLFFLFHFFFLSFYSISYSTFISLFFLFIHFLLSTLFFIFVFIFIFFPF
jgi:hypothetical protein